MDHKTYPATAVLGSMLAGISADVSSRTIGDGPDLAVNELTTDGDTVRAIVEIASGDRYEVSVRWMGEDSP